MLRPFSLSLPGAQAFACDSSSSVAASAATFARLAQATVVSRQKALASFTCSGAPHCVSDPYCDTCRATELSMDHFA